MKWVEMFVEKSYVKYTIFLNLDVMNKIGRFRRS